MEYSSMFCGQNKLHMFEVNYSQSRLCRCMLVSIQVYVRASRGGEVCPGCTRTSVVYAEGHYNAVILRLCWVYSYTRHETIVGDIKTGSRAWGWLCGWGGLGGGWVVVLCEKGGRQALGWGQCTCTAPQVRGVQWLCTHAWAHRGVGCAAERGASSPHTSLTLGLTAICRQQRQGTPSPKKRPWFFVWREKQGGLGCMHAISRGTQRDKMATALLNEGWGS